MPSSSHIWSLGFGGRRYQSLLFFFCLFISIDVIFSTALSFRSKFYVVPKPSDARWSVVWGLFFICLLYWTAPVYSAFGKILSANPEVGKLAKDAIVVYTAQLGEKLTSYYSLGNMFKGEGTTNPLVYIQRLPKIHF